MESNLTLPLAVDEIEPPKAPRAKAKAAPERVKIILEESEHIPPTGLFVGDNGVGYILVAGEEIDVPVGVVEILSNAVTAVAVVDPQTLQIIGHRPRQMYPFRRV